MTFTHVLNYSPHWRYVRVQKMLSGTTNWDSQLSKNAIWDWSQIAIFVIWDQSQIVFFVVWDQSQIVFFAIWD